LELNFGKDSNARHFVLSDPHPNSESPEKPYYNEIFTLEMNQNDSQNNLEFVLLKRSVLFFESIFSPVFICKFFFSYVLIEMKSGLFRRTTQIGNVQLQTKDYVHGESKWVSLKNLHQLQVGLLLVKFYLSKDHDMFRARREKILKLPVTVPKGKKTKMIKRQLKRTNENKNKFNNSYRGRTTSCIESTRRSVFETRASC
jgi:hypothetical protein